jgi:hypothetical protein
VPVTFAAAMGVDAIAYELVPPVAHASLEDSNQTKYQLYTDMAAARPGAEVCRLDDGGIRVWPGSGRTPWSRWFATRYRADRGVQRR